jgi:hypothetical protein
MKLKIITANIIFLLGILPYVKIFNIPFETQPWSLIVASILSIFLLYEDKFKIPNLIKILFLITVYAFLTAVYLFFKDDFNLIFAIQSLAGYVSILVFSFVGYKTFKYIKPKYFIVGISVWAVGAILQVFWGAQILAPFVKIIKTGGVRGLTSFAPEPSFYAVVCLSLLLINELFYLNKKYNKIIYFIIFLSILLQIVFSYSGIGTMLLILFAGSKILQIVFIKEDKKDKFLAISILFTILIFLSLFFNDKALGEKRGGKVLEQAVKSPITLVKNDYSVSNRIMNPVVSIYGGLVETKGLGFGVGSEKKEEAPVWISDLKGIKVKWGGKTEGGLTQPIYELGFVGVINLLLILWIIFYSIYKNEKMRPFLIASAIAMFSPKLIWGSLSIPMFGYILGIHLYYIYYKE